MKSWIVNTVLIVVVLGMISTAVYYSYKLNRYVNYKLYYQEQVQAEATALYEERIKTLEEKVNNLESIITKSTK